MSFKFKKRHRSSERKARQQIHDFAPQIKDDAQLLKLVEGATPHQRSVMLKLVVPYLSFIPKRETLACPECGQELGLLRAHQCEVANPEPITSVLEEYQAKMAAQAMNLQDELDANVQSTFDSWQRTPCST